MEASDSLLCVGLDCAVDRLPERFRRDPRPQLAFGRWIIDQTHTLVAAYKPNLAFYEARGAAGWDELAETVAYLREVDPAIFIIGDAKRADIDSTNAGYVAGLLDGLGFDAITLHPTSGQRRCGRSWSAMTRPPSCSAGRATPGPASSRTSTWAASPSGRSWRPASGTPWNARGNCMLVIGATYPAELRRARELCPDMPFLVPGVGAQGGDVETVVGPGSMTEGAACSSTSPAPSSTRLIRALPRGACATTSDRLWRLPRARVGVRHEPAEPAHPGGQGWRS